MQLIFSILPEMAECSVQVLHYSDMSAVIENALFLPTEYESNAVLL
jgi:hypothetical protein